MDLSFTSYPAGKRHAIRSRRDLQAMVPLGAGVEFVAVCGTRAILWEGVFYQDRVGPQPVNCKSCNMKKN